jgi:CCR4-NOT transcription complex subunit 1
VVTQVLSEDFAGADWMVVATKWDVASFIMNDTTQFRRLLDVYHAGAKNVPPLSAFTRKWKNTSGQLSALEAMLSLPQNVFPIALDEEEQLDAVVGVASISSPNPHCWASADFLQRLLTLSDDPSLYRRIRDQFIRCLTSCPEVLLCSLVRLQLRLANAPDRVEATNAGIQIKTELMRELIPLFFRPSRQRLQNGAGAVRRLYAISPTTVMAACFEAYRITLNEGPPSRLAAINHIINIARHLPSPTEAVANLLSGTRDLEHSIAVAFVMADCDYLQLNAWLGEKLSKSGSVTAFAASLISYLRKNFPQAGPKSESVLLRYENIVTSLQLLQGLDQSILSSVVADRTTVGDAIRALTEMCVATHPSLRNSVALKPSLSNDMGFQEYYTAVDQGKNEVEEMATAYFQRIYTSEQDIAEVVEMLKRFKNSGDKKENEIFASMVHQLFEEYRFFSRYPERELRITGILFGALIQEQLLTNITLGVALKYVLEALRKPPSPHGSTTAGSGKMFRFGMFALEQFKGRLHEWPQYCSHMIQIPHLKDGYAELVREIEHEMLPPGGPPPPSAVLAAPSQSALNHETRSIASDTDSLPDPIISSHDAEMPRIAEFGPGLGRAVTEFTEDPDYEAPPQATLDRVHFLVNNLALANVESKAAELRGFLDPTYFDWLGQYLVVKRITTQANYHPLYLSFLDSLGDYGRGLVEAVLISVYHSIGKLLRSPKITTSSSERGYLKNLGIWLGQITLARNRPIKQIMLDCRELLLQGYETGKLIAVAPFLAKTLEGAKNSVVFRPPNPWLVGILGVFRSVYNVDGLKINIKFEVEVLCKNLSIKLEDIPLRSDVLAKRIAPVKERNPDFNVKAPASTKAYPAASSQPLATIVPPQATDSGRNTPTEPPQDTVIPNLAAYVTVSATIPHLLQSQQGPLASSLSIASLKRWVPIAVDRAIREIIQPVVERSVNIACLTTKEIVTKDFAMESDETKVRKAGQLMAANLAGSLALVTCREPLRSSVSSHLRQLLAASTGRGDDLNEQEQNVIEQCVQICSSDNLELGRKLIEKAATEKAVRDVDEAMAQAITTRRQHREQTGQPFYDMSIFGDEQQRYPSALPDQLRPTPGGLLPEHFHLYERFQRISRAAILGSQGQGPATDTPAASGNRSATVVRGAETVFEGADVNQFGPDLFNSIASKLDSAISSLLAVAGTRAREIKLAMLPPDHQICRLIAAVKDIMPNSGPSGLTRQLNSSEQEVALAFSQGIFKRLYELTLSEPLRLESLPALTLRCSSG